MYVALGTKYLEETKFRNQEGQRARKEARIVHLKLTDLETRISHLERLRKEFEGKSTARCLCLCRDSNVAFQVYMLNAYQHKSQSHKTDTR